MHQVGQLPRIIAWCTVNKKLIIKEGYLESIFEGFRAHSAKLTQITNRRQTSNGRCEGFPVKCLLLCQISIKTGKCWRFIQDVKCGILRKTRPVKAAPFHSRLNRSLTGNMLRSHSVTLSAKIFGIKKRNLLNLPLAKLRSVETKSKTYELSINGDIHYVTN